ncbi:MAG: HEPN domain-containing protein [Firmicutes bacterium]|nr:HEPN domain-containing protein [Bacillota bacterium]
MLDNQNDLSKYRLEKSKEDLLSSKLLFENGLYKQSVNRSYYSIFHATRALLALDKFDSKKHSGIIAYFNQKYIATGKIEIEFSKILMSAQKIRNSSDYDEFYIVSIKDAENQINNATKFIDRIEKFLTQT